MEIIMLTVLFLAVFVLFVFFAVRSGRIQNLLKKYPQLPKYMVSGYTVFCGCFEFPLLNRHGSTALDFSRLYLFFVSYKNIWNCKGATGVCLNLPVHGNRNGRQVFPGIW